MQITFLTTGGTIDKDYAQSAGTYNFEIGDSVLEKKLKIFRPNIDYTIRSLLKKDSLDLNDKDRLVILEACQNSKTEKIIIVHGTDTMTQTAQVLSSVIDKTIVLFGSSKPAKFIDSDADFNLGVAIGAINVLEKGVYIAMNGLIFRGDQCKKELTTGRFVVKNKL